MMRGIRRLAVCTAATGLLAAVALGINIETAHADTTSCDGTQAATASAYECDLSETSISDPSQITISVSDDTSGYTEAVVINYTVSCTDTANGNSDTAGAPSEETPVTLDLTLPESADGTCTVDATITSPSVSSSASPACPTPSSTVGPSPQPSPTASLCPDDFTASLSYTAGTASASASASASATSTATAASVDGFKGYKGMCVDDNGNSSSNRAKIQIWTCGSGDKAEAWTFSNDELTHNGKCANDQGDGGSGTKVILYSCSSAGNDKWSELSNGEFKLKAHSGTLCLNDPRSSTKNGTQLIVYKCTDSANEKWSKSIS
jgi:hypothetical protein